MLRAALLTALAVLTLATVAAARTPHDPQERLNAADDARARAIVLKRSDLVGRWKAEKPSSEDSVCKSFDPDLSDLTITGKAEADFTRADGVSVFSAAEIYETEEQLAQSFRRVVRPPLVRCLHEAAKAGVGGQGTLKLLVGRKAAVPRLGDLNAHYQVIWRYTGQQRTLKVYADAYFVAKERVALTMLFFSFPAQVPAKEQRTLVQAVASRI